MFPVRRIVPQFTARARRRPQAPTGGPACSVRFAQSSYGDRQSGHEQGQELKNPKSHLEHPGPDPPSTDGPPKSSSNKSSGSSQQPSKSSQSQKTTTTEAEPKIHRPKSEAESHDAEVRKHNEEMEHRHERSNNQLSEKDNKVDKDFWKGDVGPKKGDPKSGE